MLNKLRAFFTKHNDLSYADYHWGNIMELDNDYVIVDIDLNMIGEEDFKQDYKKLTDLIGTEQRAGWNMKLYLSMMDAWKIEPSSHVVTMLSIELFEVANYKTTFILTPEIIDEVRKKMSSIELEGGNPASISDYLMQPYEPTIEHALINRITLNRTHFDTYHMITLLLRENERYKSIVEKYKDITASIYDTDDETLHKITSDKDPIEKRYLRLKLRKIDPEIEYINMKEWCEKHSEVMSTLYRGERTNRFRGLNVGDNIEFTELFSSTEDETYARKYITEGTVLVKDKTADAVLIIFKNIRAAYLRLPFDKVTVYRKFTNKETPHNSFTWNELGTEMRSNEYLSLQTSFKITKIEREDVITIYAE